MVKFLEENEYYNSSQSHGFLRSSKIAGFSPLLHSREERGAIFKLRQKHGFESCSNTYLPLVTVSLLEKYRFRDFLRNVSNSRIGIGRKQTLGWQSLSTFNCDDLLGRFSFKVKPRSER